ncbi:hypothetical protein M2337_003467 [Sphingobium sp. B2D3A]|uniref:hypothetical protein n=1 Tax=unclassified Sphingobium TaxID=2611147 RepID=UPI0022254D3E|nr:MULTISPECIES: hypothetical protein [unclassified Sphingobium]MCW2339177.1 hypothetical protein [Sphingobium sp. B2D3A]MCW2386879.1 hypothetical protein [Sphingobium sp. B2D3D]
MSGQMTLRLHGGRAPRGIVKRLCVRLARIFTMTATIAPWAALNALAACGSMVLLLWSFSDGSLLGFWHEAANLGRHYLSAAAPARAQFDFLLAALWSALFLIICVSRKASLQTRLAPSGDANS